MKIISAKSVFRLAIGAVVLAFIALAAHYYLRWKTQEYRRNLQARGERLTVAEVAPTPVPAEQNGADFFKQATASLVSLHGLLSTNPPLAMHMVGPGKAMIGWAQPGICDETDRITNSWRELEDDMAVDADALKSLRQLTNYQALDFDITYDWTSKTLVAPFDSELNAAQCLAYAAESDLNRGDTETATADLRALLQLVKATQDERTVAAQLVRIAIAQVALTSTWEFLQSPHLTEEQLARAQSGWTQIEFRQAAENALAMERAMNLEAMAKARQSSAAYRRIFGEADRADWLHRANVKSKQIVWRLWWSPADELRALKGYQVLLDGARYVQTNYAFRSRIFQQRTELAELGITTLTNRDWWEVGFANPTLRNFFSASVAVSAGNLAVIERAETCRQMAIAALALKRYQLKHGKYAPELAALVPEFLPAVPRDPIDGKPLRYQLVGTSYLLYSIGDDGVDNGGDPVPTSSSAVVSSWTQGRDSVWPQPATEQEIQAYENKLSFQGKSNPTHK